MTQWKRLRTGKAPQRDEQQQQEGPHVPDDGHHPVFRFQKHWSIRTKQFDTRDIQNRQYLRKHKHKNTEIARQVSPRVEEGVAHVLECPREVLDAPPQQEDLPSKTEHIEWLHCM